MAKTELEKELGSITGMVDIKDFLPEEMKIDKETTEKILNILAFGLKKGAEKLSGKEEGEIPKIVIGLPVKDQMLIFFVDINKFRSILLDENKTLISAISDSKTFGSEVTDLLKDILDGNLPNI